MEIIRKTLAKQTVAGGKTVHQNPYSVAVGTHLKYYYDTGFGWLRGWMQARRQRRQ